MVKEISKNLSSENMMTTQDKIITFLLRTDKK
jgi:hypothetical protein